MNRPVGNKRPVIDDAYGKFTQTTSFAGDQPQATSSEIRQLSPEDSENILASKTTKSSTLMSSKEGIFLSQQKSSYQSSASSSPLLINPKGNDKNLPVIEEELQVEEGCDNELENSRQTMQLMRQKTLQKNTAMGSPNSQFEDNKEAAVDDNTGELQLSGLQEDQFAHLEQM